MINSNSIFRNLAGMAAAVLIGGTFILTAVGPAAAAQNVVNTTAISDIVRSA